MKNRIDPTRISRVNPKGGNRACLCKDNTYHVDCCTGEMHAQGIGETETAPEE